MKNYTVGLDIGSRFVKIVTFTEKRGFEKRIFDTAFFYKTFVKKGEKSIKIDFERLGISNCNICATGYGRNNVNIENALLINELKAHVWGIFKQLGIFNFTLIDIGGQDVKIIKVTESYIDDFVMNDKCAASTGRYIENMAKLLDVKLDYISTKRDNPIDLNSTCAIFGESEIIGKIAEGEDIDSICAGINYTIAKRISSMVRDILVPPLIVSGGAALNGALIFFLKHFLHCKEILIPDEPQFNGAIGCVNYFIRFSASNNTSSRFKVHSSKL